MDILAIVTFVFFTTLVAAISWWVTRKEDLSHGTGYFLGGRGLGWFVIAGSLILTNISTEQLVGMNGNSYANGISVMAWETVAVIAMVIMAWFFLPKYLERGISTVPQYLEYRFGRNIRTLISSMTLFTVIIGMLPFILYSGAVFFESFFKVSETFGWNTMVSLYVLCTLIGLLGGAYSIFGGLKAVAVSDTINGVGLLAGGMLIPILGLMYMGEGDFFLGLEKLVTEQPERLSPLADPENPAAVPIRSLFTGILQINISYWCFGQMIVQRTFGAKSMKDGQKGVLFAAGLKLVGLLILVLPGIIAWHIFGPELDPADSAYPKLVNLLLPTWMNGFFAAVVLGAILSSFNSCLHSTSTLFGLDVWQGAIRKNASDAEAVTASKAIGIVLMVASIAVAPMISFFGEGLYASMKNIGSLFATPMAALTIAGIFLPIVSGRAAAISLIPGVVLQYIYAVGKLLPLPFGMHWLDFTCFNFLICLVLMMVLTKLFFPQRRTMPEVTEKPVDMTWSSVAIPVGIGLILAVFALYFGLAYISQPAA